MKTENYTIDAETAEAEFERWAEENDLEFETSEMDVEDVDKFTRNKRRIIKALRRGSLVINEEGEAEYTPWFKDSKSHEPLKFHSMSFTALTQIDRRKSDHQVAKSIAAIAAMC